MKYRFFFVLLSLVLLGCGIVYHITNLNESEDRNSTTRSSNSQTNTTDQEMITFRQIVEIPNWKEYTFPNIGVSVKYPPSYIPNENGIKVENGRQDSLLRVIVYPESYSNFLEKDASTYGQFTILDKRVTIGGIVGYVMSDPIQYTYIIERNGKTFLFNQGQVITPKEADEYETMLATVKFVD